MVCLGLEPGAEGWQVQTNLLSYGRPKAGPIVMSTRVATVRPFFIENVLAEAETV